MLSEITHTYSVESGGEVKMTKHEIIEMIERAGFEAVERDTVYNRVAASVGVIMKVKKRLLLWLLTTRSLTNPKTLLKQSSKSPLRRPQVPNKNSRIILSIMSQLT